MITIEIVRDDIVAIGQGVHTARELETEWNRMLGIAVDCEPGTYEEIRIVNHISDDCGCGYEIPNPDCRTLRTVTL